MASQISVYKDSILTGSETGLRHYYKCQEGMGDTIYDSGIRGIDGVLNDVGWINDAVHNYSLSFVNASKWQKATSCTDSSQFFIDNTVKHSGYYSAKIVHKCPSANQPSYLLYQIISPDTSTNYGISFWYKTTDTVYCKVSGLSMTVYTNGTFDIPIPSDSFDGNWHKYSGTFTTSDVSGNDTIDCYFGFQSSHGAYYGDIVWFDDIEICSYVGFLTSTKDYATYYPYTIDDILAIDPRASAITRNSARLRSTAWCYSDPFWRKKYDTNVGNDDFKDFWVNYFLPAEISLYSSYDGFMIDNVDAHYIMNCFNEINEYPSAGDTTYRNDIQEIFKMAKDTCANHGMIIVGNLNPIHDSASGRNLNGLLDEMAFSPYRFKASNWAEWCYNYILGYGYNRDEGWKKFYDLDTIGSLSFTMEGYYPFIPDDGYDTNRVNMTMLAHFYCIMGDSTYLQVENVDNSDQWLNILGYDIGSPVDTCYQVAQGIDINGHEYLIVGRKFARGMDTTLVLFKPMWSGTNTMYSYIPDSTLTVVNLPPGHWFSLKANGQFEREVYTENKPIYLKYSEGKILIRCECR
jgi:hypothetical protein